MNYTLRIAEPYGEIFPLYMVADALTKRVAIAGMGKMHRPTYEALLPGYIDDLICDVRIGRLQVCSQRGKSGTLEEVLVIERRLAIASNENFAISLALHVSLKSLNEWAVARGDFFDIDHGGVTWETTTGQLAATPLPTAESLPVAIPAPITPSRKRVDEVAMSDADSTPTASGPRLTMKKAALVEQHESDWPTVERDLSDANRNGLAAAAKAGAREWYEDRALEWARVKGKLQSNTKSDDSINGAMRRMAKSLPSQKHSLGD